MERGQTQTATAVDTTTTTGPEGPATTGGADQWLPGTQTLQETAEFVADHLWMASAPAIAWELGTQVGRAKKLAEYEAGQVLDEVTGGIQEGADELRGETREGVREVDQGLRRVSRTVEEAISDIEAEGANIDARLGGVGSTAQAVEAMANQVAATTDDPVLKAGAETLAGAAGLVNEGVSDLQNLFEADRARFSRTASDFQRQLDRELGSTSERAHRAAEELSDSIGDGADDITREIDRQRTRAELVDTTFTRLVHTVKDEIRSIFNDGLPEIGWPGSDDPPAVIPGD